MRKLAMVVLSIGLTFGCGDDDDDAVTVDSAVVTGDSGAGNVGWAGCGAGTPFMDLTSAGASRMVTITATPSYSPKCIRVKMGQMVTIAAEVVHPLKAPTGNPAGSPIVDSTTPLTVTMNQLGVHGWYCNVHGTSSGQGMAGAVEVVP